MQRSRRALLQRRAIVEKNSSSGRKRLYKVSLSLVLFSWGLIFLLNSFISHGDGYTVGESTWHEASAAPNKGSDSGDVFALSETASNNDVQNTCMVDEATEHNTLVTEENEAILLTVRKEQAADLISDSGIKAERETPLKSERLSRVAPPGLDEFKSKTITGKEKRVSGQTGNVIIRVEPGGKEYNYASATKGAKVLAFNKEAKGVSNILDKDKDKYLRNPCSAEEKYVVIELSEETLVDTIELANFEHYSSNFKDFELLSSLVYPTDSWVKLGNYTAGNVKHAQRFSLQEPKWARYLKLNLLSHYGAEFYCTLSVVEVYGVDAVERMLEDLISVQNDRFEPEEQNAEHMSLQEPADAVDLYRKLLNEIDYDLQPESVKIKREVSKTSVGDPTVETRAPQIGRMPGDTVLKILMQKVQSLDVNFSVLERYLEELNNRYGRIFKEFDDDISDKDFLLEKIKLEIKSLQNSKDVFANDIGELFSWKTIVSSQLDQLVKDNAILRSDVQRVHDHQADMEIRGLAVIFMSFVFGCLAATKLFIDMLLSICRVQNSEHFCRISSGWLVLLLSSSLVALILAL